MKMNEREALLRLQDIEYECMNFTIHYYTDEDIPMLQIATKALEKCIPKKPDIEADGYADGQLVYDTWVCPCCEEHYEVDYDDYEYCPKCGQCIDWSE